MEDSYKYNQNKYARVATLIVLSFVYASAKPSLDLIVGKDSVWTRYMARPLYNYLSNGALATEEQWQAALEEQRKKIKRHGLASIIRTLP